MNHAQPPASTTASIPAAAGHSVPNGISATITRSALDNHPSPATDSPQTPVDSSLVPDVKIDMDYQEQESDVRHEPLPVKQLDHHAKIEPDSSNYAVCCPSFTFDLLSGTLPIPTPPDANGNGHLNGHHDDVVIVAELGKIAPPAFLAILVRIDEIAALRAIFQAGNGGVEGEGTQRQGRGQDQPGPTACGTHQSAQ